MKKTDFGIDLNSAYGKHWLDKDTYVVCYDLADDEAYGKKQRCWLETEYHADEKRIVFVRTMEDDYGSCDSYNVEKILPKKVIKQIIADYRNLIGDKLVL